MPVEQPQAENTDRFGGAPSRPLGRQLRLFLRTEAGGGLVLLVAAVLALGWANSPFRESYDTLWGAEFRLSLGSLTIGEDLRQWVNEGLMTLFFLVVGLEIRRELVVGELNQMRKALLPVFAALGGMLVPALLYLALNAGGETQGWGIPMATDIAFAVGLLALLGSRVPAGLKLFILTLAIADDIGAIVVIALFYAEGIELGWLSTACVGVAGVIMLRRLRVAWVPIYLIVGVGVWLATLKSGVHATIAGVALGLLTPVRPQQPNGTGVAERLERFLHPWTNLLVVPVFAIANAGVNLRSTTLGDVLSSRVALGVMLGLVVGKLIGISGMAFIATRLRLGELPDGVEWPHLMGGAAVAGIGFTVSLFIAARAFGAEGPLAAAKMGVLLGSLAAGLIGSILLLRASPAEPKLRGSRKK